VHDKVLADLLVHVGGVGMNDHAGVGLLLVGRLGRVQVVDAGLQRARLVYFLIRPSAVLFGLNDALTVHDQEAFFHRALLWLPWFSKG